MISYLKDSELLLIRGGGEPVKPVSRPKDFYDEEETLSATNSNNVFSWREWLRTWLDRK